MVRYLYADALYLAAKLGIEGAYKTKAKLVFSPEGGIAKKASTIWGAVRPRWEIPEDLVDGQPLPAPSSYRIFVTLAADYEHTYITLAHELRHLYQYEQLQLSSARFNTVWKQTWLGEPFDIPEVGSQDVVAYNRLPWEVDANNWAAREWRIQEKRGVSGDDKWSTEEILYV